MQRIMKFKADRPFATPEAAERTNGFSHSSRPIDPHQC
jgi:hypothetical protein